MQKATVARLLVSIFVLGVCTFPSIALSESDKPLKTIEVPATPSLNSRNNANLQNSKPTDPSNAPLSIKPKTIDAPSPENLGQVVASSKQSDQKETSTSSTGLKPISYDLALRHVDGTKGDKLPSDITDDFTAVALLVSLKDRPVYSKFALNKRIDEDAESLKKIAFFYGYYDTIIEIATSKASAQKPGGKTSKSDVTVSFQVTLGKRYTVKTLDTKFTRKSTGPQPCLIHRKEYDVDLGKPFTANNVLDTFAEIKTHLGTCGYPFANVVSHEAIIDRTSKSVRVILNVDQGPFVRFGVTKVKKSQDVPKTYIKNRSPLTEGEPYNQEIVDEYQDTLSTTKLFKSIQIKRSKKEEDIQDGEAVDVDVSVEEGPPRTISAGAKYGTSEGIGFDLRWLHRNMFGKADRFKVETHVAQNERSAGLTYELPDFLKVDQTLKLNLDYKVEKRDAYRSNGFGLSAVLRNDLPDDWYYFYGLSFENAAIDEKGVRTRVGAIGLPLGVGVNRVNDILNPTHGHRFDLTVTPEFGNVGNSSAIARSLLYGAYHIPLDELERNTISFWGRLGLLFGADAPSLPANRKFFGGGSGSVRGYARDFLSPVNAMGQPLGGKSLLEFGVEPRFRFTKTWGMVAFLEGGVINDKTYPSFNENFLFGAGLGLRYYTDFGPIRADIAFPFKRRTDATGKKVDSALQFYISIGQAF